MTSWDKGRIVQPALPLLIIHCGNDTKEVTVIICEFQTSNKEMKKIMLKVGSNNTLRLGASLHPKGASTIDCWVDDHNVMPYVTILVPPERTRDLQN